MRCFIGIDLGSTTTKAVVIDENRNILGRGITNSRSNYDTAAAIAKQEALVNSRFHLFRQALGTAGALDGALDGFLGQLERDFRSEQYLEQLGDLEATCQRSLATAKFGDATGAVGEALTEVFKRLTAEAPDRAERARLLATVTAHGFIDDYAGVRISRNGKRFQIARATVWNLRADDGRPCGQAATFR